MTILLSSQDLTKTYARPLFAGISLDLRAGERVGLIGPNGSGKSTLLKILAGLETPDDGTVAMRRSARLGYLPQDESFEAGHSVEQVLFDALEDDSDEEHDRLTRVGITLGKVGFSSGDAKVDSLSGGWRKRLAIARQLVRGPDLLLLDEPTNHLDLEGILWFEELLQDASFAYVVVSHDRYFLENVTNQIVELDRVYAEGYFRVTGAYTDFLGRRSEHLAGQSRQEQTLANKVRREVEWLKQGAKARTGKSAARTQEANRLIDDLQALKTRNAASGKVGIDFVGTGRKSTNLLTSENLGISISDRLLFSGLSLTLAPGTKIGLLGPNGSGKTTLLRILAGELPPDTGAIKRAEGLRMVTFDQDRRQLDRSATLQRALAPNTDEVLYRGRPYHISAWAKRFLFRSEQLELPVSDLSGGEQARILIARLMLQPADVLLLDEPTNDLDLPTLELLEESLAEFPGALVLVTHDRSLLDRLCTEILGLDGQGRARIYADYSQWAAAQRELDAPKPKPATQSKPAKAPRKKASKLTYQEKLMWDQMEERILAAEELVAAREQDVEAAGTDHVQLQESCRALQEAQEAVEKLYACWQELEAKQLPDG